MKFRKRPVVIDAERVDRDKLHRLSPGFRAAVCRCMAITRDIAGEPRPDPHVHTLEGPMRVPDGSWLIKGIAGEFYACAPDIFEATYEPVDDGEEVT
jgi:hypothetical protein